MKQLFIFIVCLAISNCSSSEPKKISSSNGQAKNLISEAAPKTITTKKIDFKNKYQDIAKLIGKSCESSSQCKIIGVGASPCGGFASYQIYSESDTNIKLLKQSVDQFNQLMKIHNQKNKLLGICRHIEPPKVACHAKQCGSLKLNNLL